MKQFEINVQDTSAARRPGRRASRLAAFLGAMAITAIAGAEPALENIEACLESGTRLATLPGVAGGTLSASECRGCPSLRLRFDRGTSYYIGKEPVTYAKLREAAAKGDLALNVFYSPKTKTLTRLRLAAAGQ